MKRRDFLRYSAACASAAAGLGTATSALAAGTDRVPIGLDGHALRGMKWKAPQFIEFAAEHKLDAVLINNLPLFDSLDDAYLRGLRQTADDHGLKIYVGAGSICQIGASFNDRYGDTQTLLAEGIRVATTLGSPVVTVRIGSIKDRYLEGGIRPRIDESIRVLKAFRQRGLDAGIKFGFENHAADLRTDEVLEIIDAVGPDVCGSMLDPGNAVWAMEDPMKQLQQLGKHVVCTSIRDYTIWPAEDGATFQWTSIGNGLMDVPAYLGQMAADCPGVPLFIETISHSQRPLPFLEKQWWDGFPNVKAAEIVDFLALIRRGGPLPIPTPPEGVSKKAFDQQQQVDEFLKSVAYLRQHGAGRNG